MRDQDAAPAQIAVIFMIFAIAQEHTSPKPSTVEADTRSVYLCCFEHQVSGKFK